MTEKGEATLMAPRMDDRVTGREANSHWFNLFNAVASQAAMGAPIILLANSLQASSLFLGIVAALSPLSTILQIPTARFLHATEYRTTLLVGWFLRTLFIFPVSLLALASFLDADTKRITLLLILVTFNILRGISTAAWWPWIAELIPENRRGRFLARDQLFTYVGGMGALGVYGLVMSGNPSATAFMWTFLIGGICGLISLGFLSRMPNPLPAQRAIRPGHPVGWRTVLAQRPFLKLIALNVVLTLVIGSLNVFTVQFLRDVRSFSAESILYLSAATFLGPIAILNTLGRWTDRQGPGVVLTGVLIVYGAVAIGWLLVALGIVPCGLSVVAALQVLAGIATAVFNVANIHLALMVIPQTGRNRFLAFFTASTSLSLGAAPVFFGYLLDSIGNRNFVFAGQLFDRHAIYFATLCLLALAGFVILLFRFADRPKRRAIA